GRIERRGGLDARGEKPAARSGALDSPRRSAMTVTLHLVSTPMTTKPRLLITMGDVAGIGPEIIARAWPRLLDVCRPVVVGDVDWLRRALAAFTPGARVRVVQNVEEVEATAEVVPCLAGSGQDL